MVIHGEAGVGKSSLVEAARAQLPAETRMLVGYCDDLATARTLGPFRDLAGAVGAELTEAVRHGDREDVLAALRTELVSADRPTVLAVEDLHWADDATLDVLRYLLRWVRELLVLLLLTYRDDELRRDHPLATFLGEASRAEQVRGLPLGRLSEHAVRSMVDGSGLASASVYALTAGNPFFVHELLGAGHSDRTPLSVVDAVLGRLRRLDAPVQDAVEQLAVMPSMPDRALVAALVRDAAETLAVAEQWALLSVWPDRVAFRHELTRRAVADALPAARRIELNRRVLGVLVDRPEADLARIVHHANEAGDRGAVLRYGPAAAREAVKAGAHREAAAFYATVLRYADEFAPAARADLWEGRAIECYTLGHSPEAIAAQTEAVRLRRAVGDRNALGASLRWLSRMEWWNARRADAEAAAEEAVAVLADGDRRLYAMALSNSSQLAMLAEHNTTAVALGEQAIELAR